MTIHDTYIIEAAPGNEFVLELCALATKYGVTVTRTIDVAQRLHCSQITSKYSPFRDEQDKEHFMKMVKTDIKNQMADYLLDEGILKFNCEDTTLGTETVGYLTVMTI